MPNQRVQPVFVDIYIPHDATPGAHHGSIGVRAGGRLLRQIAVDVQVLPLALPDKLNFIVDLNAYGGVNSGYDVARGTPEYRKLLQAYHRVAHLNRANLDILGYSHSGSTEPDQTPPLSGEGAATKVANWTDWDAHYGPLVSGSAFADLPRASVPVPIIYLAFFENWPGDLRKTYKWNIPEHPKTTAEYQQLIARHALSAGPIEEGFPQDYQDRFSAVARRVRRTHSGAELEANQVPDLLQRQVLLQGSQDQSRPRAVCPGGCWTNPTTTTITARSASSAGWASAG